MPTAEQKIDKAIDRIYDEYSWLSLIAGDWDIIEFPKNPLAEMLGTQPNTMATDGPHLYFDRRFVESLSQKDLDSIVMHEAAHIFLGHAFRLFEVKAGNEEKWQVTPSKNVAADLALNWYIRDDFDKTGEVWKMICLPGRAASKPGELDFSMLPTGKDAEYYLKAMPEKMKKQLDGDGQDGMGGQSMTLDELKQAIKDGKVVVIGGGVLPHPSMKPGKDGKMPSEKDVKQAKEKWERQVIGGIMNAEGCGHDPGEFKEIAEKLKPKASEIPWEAYLRRFVTKNVKVRYSYAKPNRRSAYRSDIRIPARLSREATEGVFLVDTSGSMYIEEMNRALREAEKVLVAFPGSKVTLRQADTQLQKTEQTFTRWDFPMKVPQTWSGRGGTELAAPIIEVAKQRQFKWMIVVSDMIWNYRSAKDPGIPVFWLQTKDFHKDVPFGYPIHCKD